MSTTTTNLGLFKYDTSTDAQVAFSITNALNNNWDKIDTAIANISGVTTTASGRSWYRQWSNGWKEQGGELDTATTTKTWTTPALNNNTSYGTISSTRNTGSEYLLFTGGSYDVAIGSTSATIYWTFPNPVKFTSIKVTPGFTSGASSNISAITIKGKNSSNSWQQLGTQSFSNGASSQVTINLTALQTTQISLVLSHSYAYTQWPGRVKNIIFTGQESVTASSSITFPISFNNTNYSYAFGCYGGSGINVYTTAKTLSGMNLYSTNATQASWIAMGY